MDPIFPASNHQRRIHSSQSPCYVALAETSYPQASASSSSPSSLPSRAATTAKATHQHRPSPPHKQHRRKPQARVLLTTVFVIALTTLTSFSTIFSRSPSDFSAIFQTAFSAPPASRPVNVALTRPIGENRPLAVALERAMLAQGMQPEMAQCLEVPCIEHGPGPDKDRFEEDLVKLQDQTIVLTSPTGALTFLESWDAAIRLARKLENPPSPALENPTADVADDANGAAAAVHSDDDMKNDVGKEPPKFAGRLVCLGKGTAKVIEKAGLEAAFMPSKADAETLAAELPEEFGPNVVYPASEIAPDTLQAGLESRGFSVKRYNAYTTRPVDKPSEELLAAMENTEVVTFSSPSSVNAWTKHSKNRPLCACIGDTSKKAAEDSGFPGLFAPQSPGLEGWATALVDAIKVHLLLRSDGAE